MASPPPPIDPESRKAFVQDDPQNPTSPEDIPMPDTDPLGEEGQGPKVPEKKERPGWGADGYKTMKKINRLAPNDYYGFLSLEKTCSAGEIKEQYKALALLTHPDKNKYPGAKKAFQRVSEAYQVLKDSARRSKYDKQKGEVYSTPNLMDPEALFGEEFGPNAFGDDSDSEDQEDEESGSESVKSKPNPAHLAIYNSATPFIQSVLAHPPMNDEEKQSNLKEVNAFNHQIKEQNRQDGLKDNDLFQHYIEYTIFESHAIQAKPYIDKLADSPQDSKAKEWVSYFNAALERTIRKHGYPTSWTLMESALPRAKPEAEPKATGRTGKGARDPPPGTDTKSHTSGQTAVSWRPGLTLAGDEIIGVLPRERRFPTSIVDGVQVPAGKRVTGYQFITVRTSESGSTIALESGQEVGNRATAGYLSLPKEMIHDLRYSDKRYDQDDAENFDKLVDFASNPFHTRSSDSPRFPPGYGLVHFKNGDRDVLSRTALRKVLGKTDADWEIQECEKRNGITPAWTVKPLGWREPRSMVIESGKRHNQRLGGRGTKRYDPKQRQSDSQDDKSDTDESLFVQSKSGRGRGGRRSPSRSVSRSSAQALDEVSKVRNDVAELKAMMEKFMLGGK